MILTPMNYHKNQICLLLFAAALPMTALLMANAHAAETNTAAAAWQEITNFSLPQPPMSWQTNTPTQADLATFDDERAAQAGVLADKAKGFYTRFPDDANATRARVTEIQALQAAIHFGASNRVDELDRREESLLAKTNAPEQLRYELRLDLLGRQLNAASESGADMQAEMEKAGRQLVKEFPGGPMGYEILLNLTVNCDLAKMHDLAEVMANSGGPTNLTEMGKGILNQLDILGKPLPIAFTTPDGRTINSTTLSNKVVLVDFWATWCPFCVKAIPEVKDLYDRYHTNGFEVVGINFDDNTNAARQFIKEHDMPWPEYYGGFGADNQYGRKFGEALPYVWLVDKKGIVQDIHGRTETEAKIKKLLAE